MGISCWYICDAPSLSLPLLPHIYTHPPRTHTTYSSLPLLDFATKSPSFHPPVCIQTALPLFIVFLYCTLGFRASCSLSLPLSRSLSLTYSLPLSLSLSPICFLTSPAPSPPLSSAQLSLEDREEEEEGSGREAGRW